MLLGKALKRRKGFGIVEVLVSAAVLGFLYLALMNLQLGNRQTLLRIRGRDAAVEVAQQVLDSLQANGVNALPAADDGNPVIVDGLDYERTWERGTGIPGDKSRIVYKTKIKVMPDSAYVVKNKTGLDSISHVYAKNVVVTVSWPFKGSTQSIDISGVIR